MLSVALTVNLIPWTEGRSFRVEAPAGACVHYAMIGVISHSGFWKGMAAQK